MTNEEKKLQKQEYLAEVLHRCENREPTLSLDEIAEVIAEQVSDLTEFLKKYKKQLKNNV